MYTHTYIYIYTCIHVYSTLNYALAVASPSCFPGILFRNCLRESHYGTLLLRNHITESYCVIIVQIRLGDDIIESYYRFV